MVDEDAVEESGLWRIVAIGVAVAAVIGWGLLAWTTTQSSSDETALRDQVAKLQGERDGLGGELARQRDAVGTLADITAKRDAAEAQARRAVAAAQVANRARDAAAADLATLQGQAKATADEQTRLKASIAELGAQRDHATADVDATRQQGDTLKQAFAKASDQLAGKNSELADLNDKVQKARGEKAAQDAAQAEAAQAVARAQAEIKSLLDQRGETERAVAELTAQNARDTQARVELEQQTGALRQQVAGATADLTQLQARIAEAKAAFTAQNARQAENKADLEQQVGTLQQRSSTAAADLGRLEAEIARAKGTLDRQGGEPPTAPATQPASP